MAFEALRARIAFMRNEVNNPRYLATMVMDSQAVIRSNAPNLSGLMTRNLTTATPVVPTQGGLHAGLGDRGIVGKEDDSAPRGVIKQFLADHPEFKIGRDKKRKKKQKPTGGRSLGLGERVQQEFQFDKRKAWAYLPTEAKVLLAQARQEGEYGGKAGASPYFFQQEGSLDNWAGGAYAANIHPTHFLQSSMDEWRADYRGMVISELNRKLGLE